MLFSLLKGLVDSCLWLNCMILDSLIKFEVLQNFRLPRFPVTSYINCLGRNGMDIAVDNRKNRITCLFRNSTMTPMVHCLTLGAKPCSMDISGLRGITCKGDYYT